MKGYLLYTNPSVIDSTSFLRDGWYDTLGDIVVIDEEDFVYIRGRVKRFAKIAGEMISLEVVEQDRRQGGPSSRMPPPRGRTPPRVKTIVLFTTSPSLTRDRLSAAAKTMGASELAVPRAIVCLAEIPLLGTGKTDYVRLKTLAEAKEPSPPAPAAATG